jgi:hypothetical protein
LRDITFNYDPGNTWHSLRQDYDSTATIQNNPVGRLIYTSYSYNDGTSQDTSCDFTANVLWKSLRQDYDTAEQTTYQYYVFDNVTSRDNSFDFTPTVSWPSLQQDYDSAEEPTNAMFSTMARNALTASISRRTPCGNHCNNTTILVIT